MLDVTKLATLRAVIAHRSFSAAGKRLALTQPAVSRQISLLEAQVGIQLVRRTQRGVQATEAGRLLDAHAEAILERIALAERAGRPAARGCGAAPCGSARSSPRWSTSPVGARKRARAVPATTS